MLKHVYFFIDENGRSPVEEMMEDLTEKENMKIRAYFKILKEFGHMLRRPIAGYLGEGIYELRPGPFRVFYFFFIKDSVVLLHMLRKKTDQIPLNDFNLCVKRKKEVEGSGNIKESEL